MGLLDKTNPQATRESVIRWAVGGGSLFVIILLIKLAWSSSPDPNWPWLVLAGGIAGAFLGGLMEWQLFDSDLYEVMLEVDEEFAVTLVKTKNAILSASYTKWYSQNFTRTQKRLLMRMRYGIALRRCW